MAEKSDDEKQGEGVDVEKMAKEEVRAALKERLGNPFICSFLIAWIVANWQLILHLGFGSGSVSERIDLVLGAHCSHWNLIWLPICSALVFVVGSPWLEVLAEFIQSKARTKSCKSYYKRRATLKTASEEADMISQKEFKLKSIEHSSDVAKKEKELEDLKVDLSSSKDLSRDFKAWRNDKDVWDKLKNKEVEMVNEGLRSDLKLSDEKVISLEDEVFQLERQVSDLNTMNERLSMERTELKHNLENSEERVELLSNKHPLFSKEEVNEDSTYQVDKNVALSVDEISELAGIKTLNGIEKDCELTSDYYKSLKGMKGLIAKNNAISKSLKSLKSFEGMASLIIQNDEISKSLKPLKSFEGMGSLIKQNNQLSENMKSIRSFEGISRLVSQNNRISDALRSLDSVGGFSGLIRQNDKISKSLPGVAIQNKKEEEQN